MSRLEVRERRPRQEAPLADRTPTDLDRTPSDGLDHASANASSDWWFQGALIAIQQLAITRRGFTVDHLLDLVGAPTDSHYVGAAFAAAQRRKIIEAVGARVGQGGKLRRVWWGLPT